MVEGGARQEAVAKEARNRPGMDKASPRGVWSTEIASDGKGGGDEDAGQMREGVCECCSWGCHNLVRELIAN